MLTLPVGDGRNHPSVLLKGEDPHLEDARRFKAEIERQLARGEYLDPALGRQTLDEYFSAFLAGSNIRSTTRDLYQRHYRLYIAPTFGMRRISSIAPTDVRAWVTSLQEGGTGQPTVKAVLRLLKTILNRAVADEVLTRSPASSVPVPSVKPHEMRFLSAEEVSALAGSVPAAYESLIYLLAYGGLRIGEAAALTVQDLDLLRGRVTVDKGLVEVAGKIEINPTKTGQKRRVSLPTFLREMLSRHLKRFPPVDGYVFTSPEGGPLRPNNFRRRVFKKAVKTAGLDPLRIHDLRHTCVALLVAQGAHAKEIADRLGHSSPIVTMTTYAHILPSLDERLSEGLEETFRNATGARVSSLVRDARFGDTGPGVSRASHIS